MPDQDPSKKVAPTSIYTGYKRLNYFQTQFLTDLEFKDEQSFHLEMMRRHNAKLHIAGIVEGLAVVISNDQKTITVAPGSAIDSAGREIVVANGATLAQPDFSQCLGRDKVMIVISWGEQASTDAQDQYTGGTQTFTRWVPNPTMSAVPSPVTPSPNTPFVVLAQVSVGADGKLSQLDPSVRVMAESRISRASSLQLGTLVIGPANQTWTPYPNNGPLTIIAPSGNDWLTLVPGGADTNFFLRNGGDSLLIGYVQRGNTPKIWNHLTLQSSTGNLGVGTSTASDRLTVGNGALAFQKTGETRSVAGIDYDVTTDALRVRFNSAASGGTLSATALSIERQTGNVKIPTGSLEVTTGNLNVTAGNLTVPAGNVQITNGSLGVSSAPDPNFVADVFGPLRIKNTINAGLQIVSGDFQNPPPGAGIIIGVQQSGRATLLIFADGNNNVFMTIDTNGNIATKTANPPSKLANQTFKLF